MKPSVHFAWLHLALNLKYCVELLQEWFATLQIKSLTAGAGRITKWTDVKCIAYQPQEIHTPCFQS